MTKPYFIIENPKVPHYLADYNVHTGYIEMDSDRLQAERFTTMEDAQRVLDELHHNTRIHSVDLEITQHMWRH